MVIDWPEVDTCSTFTATSPLAFNFPRIAANFPPLPFPVLPSG